MRGVVGSSLCAGTVKKSTWNLQCSTNLCYVFFLLEMLFSITNEIFALVSAKCARGDVAALHFRHQRSTFFEFALVCVFFARICARFAHILRSFAAA